MVPDVCTLWGGFGPVKTASGYIGINHRDKFYPGAEHTHRDKPFRGYPSGVIRLSYPGVQTHRDFIRVLITGKVDICKGLTL